MQKKGIRYQIYSMINMDQDQPPVHAVIFEAFITILIVLSIIAIVAESFVNNRYNDNLIEWLRRVDRNQEIRFYFSVFENITLVIFTLEYFLRILTADFRYPEEKNFGRAAWKFMSSGGGIIDFVAISPFLFQLAKVDFRFLRALKISRLLRVLKLSSLTRSIVIVGDVFIEKRYELGITLFVTFVLLLVSATLMWYVEGNVQPGAFPNIIATFWWAIATLTTVGYGDVFPITAWGKLLSGIIAILGIGIVALPAGILSSAFIERLEKDPDFTDMLEQEDGQAAASELEEAASIPAAADASKHCAARFGEQFAFCPYCGEQLDAHGHHLKNTD